MGRILPFYRTGGALSGGGGGGGNTGVPLGPFADWLALPASAPDGAIAGVLDLGPTSSSGLAVYDAGTGQWQLLLGYFLTLADLNAFTDPKALTAVAAVGPSLNDPTSVRYQWDDPNVQWLRTPDPVEYIYSASQWSALPTQDTIQPMDEVTVNDLGYSHSSGRGQRHGNEWRLIEGKFASVSDMTAFDGANVVHTDAIGLVKAGGGHDEEAIAYSYQGGTFVRFGTTVTAGYAWTLSSTRDFSAIGLQDGDFGIYTPSGGEPVLLRYVAACTAVGGGTLQAWVIPDMYGRANLQIVCYVEGSEAPPAYGGTRQGYQYDRTGAATITSVNGYMRMDAPAPGAGSQFAFLTSPAISGAKRFYVQTEVRGVTAGTLGQAGFFDLSSVGISQWALASQRNVSSAVVLPIGWNGSAYVAALTGTAVRNGGNALPASTPWLVEGYSSGGAITDMMATRIDGFSYCALRRNFDSATVSTNFNVVPLAAGNVTGTSSGQLEIRRHYVFTSD